MSKVNQNLQSLLTDSLDVLLDVECTVDNLFAVQTAIVEGHFGGKACGNALFCALKTLNTGVEHLRGMIEGARLENGQVD